MYIIYTVREVQISIHALREEGDEYHFKIFTSVRYFYPRPPRGGRPDTSDLRFCRQCISIHALREEGDAFLK